MRNYTPQKTKKGILKAARELFVRHGFAGTSISDIAQKAGIPQSLIYHHFKNKSALWKEVKLDFFAERGAKLEPIPARPETLRGFLETIIRTRFEFYNRNPDISRMMMWQKLEEKKKDLMGVAGLSPVSWRDGIVHLQEKGQMRQDLDPEMIILWIAGSVAGALSDDYFFLENDTKKKQDYIRMIIDCIEKGLKQ